MEVERYRTQLLNKRGELLGGTAAKPLQWTMENNSGRQGDMADQASGTGDANDAASSADNSLMKTVRVVTSVQYYLDE